MTISFNHTIVFSRDRAVSAHFFTELFGLPDPVAAGPFLAVALDNGVTLDFATSPVDVLAQHYAFLVSEADFDSIYGRIRARVMEHWADPRKTRPGEINQRRRPRRLLPRPGRPQSRDHHPALRFRRMTTRRATPGQRPVGARSGRYGDDDAALRVPVLRGAERLPATTGAPANRSPRVRRNTVGQGPDRIAGRSPHRGRSDRRGRRAGRLRPLLTGGERVAVYPPFQSLDLGDIAPLRPPLGEPRFVLDVHLGRLARYLRLLGFDSVYSNDRSDDELLAVSRGQDRVLLTRDVGLLERAALVYGGFLHETDSRLQLREASIGSGCTRVSRRSLGVRAATGSSRRRRPPWPAAGCPEVCCASSAGSAGVGTAARCTGRVAIWRGCGPGWRRSECGSDLFTPRSPREQVTHERGRLGQRGAHGLEVAGRVGPERHRLPIGGQLRGQLQHERCGHDVVGQSLSQEHRPVVPGSGDLEQSRTAASSAGSSSGRDTRLPIETPASFGAIVS